MCRKCYLLIVCTACKSKVQAFVLYFADIDKVQAMLSALSQWVMSIFLDVAPFSLSAFRRCLSA